MFVDADVGYRNFIPAPQSKPCIIIICGDAADKKRVLALKKIASFAPDLYKNDAESLKV
jgi:hypothetical protein